MIRMTLELSEIKWSASARSKAPTPKRTSCMLDTMPDDAGFARQFGQPVTGWLDLSATKRQRQYVLRDESRCIDHHTTVILEGKEVATSPTAAPAPAADAPCEQCDGTGQVPFGLRWGLVGKYAPCPACNDAALINIPATLPTNATTDEEPMNGYVECETCGHRWRLVNGQDDCPECAYRPHITGIPQGPAKADQELTFGGITRAYLKGDLSWEAYREHERAIEARARGAIVPPPSTPAITSKGMANWLPCPDCDDGEACYVEDMYGDPRPAGVCKTCGGEALLPPTDAATPSHAAQAEASPLVRNGMTRCPDCGGTYHVDCEGGHECHYGYLTAEEEVEQTITCLKCHGHGRFGGNNHKCSLCQGRGTLASPYLVPSSHTLTTADTDQAANNAGDGATCSVTAPADAMPENMAGKEILPYYLDLEDGGCFYDPAYDFATVDAALARAVQLRANGYTGAMEIVERTDLDPVEGTWGNEELVGNVDDLLPTHTAHVGACCTVTTTSEEQPTNGLMWHGMRGGEEERDRADRFERGMETSLPPKVPFAQAMAVLDTLNAQREREAVEATQNASDEGAAHGEENRQPAEVFPPSVFILDELAARGWGRDDILRRSHLSAIDLDDIMDRCLPITNDSAIELARAFGTSSLIWLRIDATFRPYFDQFVADLEVAVRANPAYTVSEDGMISDAPPVPVPTDDPEHEGRTFNAPAATWADVSCAISAREVFGEFAPTINEHGFR